MPYPDTCKQLLVTDLVLGAAMVSNAADASDACREIPMEVGKVMSSEQTGIPYGGTLAPRTGYFMRVKLWDRNNLETPWSEVAICETAMISLQDLKALRMGWGSPNLNYVRREFQIEAHKTIGRGRLRGARGELGDAPALNKDILLRADVGVPFTRQVTIFKMEPKDESRINKLEVVKPGF